MSSKKSTNCCGVVNFAIFASSACDLVDHPTGSVPCVNRHAVVESRYAGRVRSVSHWRTTFSRFTAAATSRGHTPLHTAQCSDRVLASSFRKTFPSMRHAGHLALV
jgi:hypothetical protein